jgi:hypothetical protein
MAKKEKQMLEPCECGGEAAAKTVSYIRGHWSWIQCKSCLTRSNDHSTREEAIEEWNARVRGSRQPKARATAATKSKRRR